jgi:hypothetical protein
LHGLDNIGIKPTHGVVKNRMLVESTGIGKHLPVVLHLLHVSHETPEISDIGVECLTDTARRRRDLGRRVRSTADNRQETQETHEGCL